MLEGVATPHARQDPRRGSGIELAVAPNDLVSLLEENKLLREKLRSIKWPPLRSFQAYGHTYGLPVAAAAPAPAPGAEDPKTSHLQYLAGFLTAMDAASQLSGVLNCRLANLLIKRKFWRCLGLLSEVVYTSCEMDMAFKNHCLFGEHPGVRLSVLLGYWHRTASSREDNSSVPKIGFKLHAANLSFKASRA